MADKTITDFKKSVYVIASVVATASGAAAAELVKLFAPFLAAGEKLPDWELDQKLKIRLLEQLWRELYESDDAYEENRQEQERLRGELDAARRAVHGRLLSLKRTLSGLSGRKAGKSVWLRGEIPRNQTPLEREAEYARRKLRGMKKRRTAEGVEVDPAAWAEVLEREAKAMKKADRELRRAVKEGVKVAAQRRRAKKEYGTGFVRIAGELEAQYRLAGLEEEARVLRPSKKYPGRTQAEIRQLGKAGSKKRSGPPGDEEEAS